MSLRIVGDACSAEGSRREVDDTADNLREDRRQAWILVLPTARRLCAPGTEGTSCWTVEAPYNGSVRNVTLENITRVDGSVADLCGATLFTGAGLTGASARFPQGDHDETLLAAFGVVSPSPATQRPCFDTIEGCCWRFLCSLPWAYGLRLNELEGGRNMVGVRV